MNEDRVTMKRVDHFGLTVPDLEEARRFFVDVLGGEVMFELGAYEPPSGEWMQTHINVHSEARMHRRVFVSLAESVLEIFEYRSPDQTSEPPRNSDVGGHHIAFYVDDIDAAVAHLRSRDVRVLEGPTESGGLSEGTRWIYVVTPWGMQLELVSYPNGRVYDRLRESGGGDPGA